MSTANHNDDLHNELQQQLQDLLSDLQLDDAPAGGSLVVYEADHCVAKVAIGMARADMKWQPDTLALNFSTGKGVLATLVHILVSNKLLDYDTPIATYWPEFAANNKAAVTLRAVMSHQAQLFSINAIEVDRATLLDWSAMIDIIANISSHDVNDAGSFVSAYSALVYGWILGGLIEKVTNMPLAKALRHYLTAPLGITDSCYFGVPDDKVAAVATLVKHFQNVTENANKNEQQNNISLNNTTDNDNSNNNNSARKRQKPILKADSKQTLAQYEKLPSYGCWQQLAANNGQLSAVQINQLYFDHSAINASNYKQALVPASKQPLDYYDTQTLQAVLPAANGVASAAALATIYAMLANGGVWQGKTFIDDTTFAQLSEPQVTGTDAVMPASMNWRLGYHKLFSIYQNNESTPTTERGFGHMGYNGSVAWCEPTRQLSFAFVHNFDIIMLNDIRQFALTEAVLKLIDTKLS